MKKIALVGPLIVEGKEDKAFLSSYIESPILILNGLDIKSPVVSILKRYCNEITFILLTDPDEAGDQIRINLKNNKINVENVYLNEIRNVRGNKKGVAEADIECIKQALKGYINENYKKITVSNTIFYKYSLIGQGSKTKRAQICKKLGVDLLSANNFKLLLEILKIDEEGLANLLG